MRSRQPLLIRENYTEEMRKLGVDVQNSHEGSFCGVPLLLYERPIGAMILQSPQERALDFGHLEMMRVLASEAVIALENARLFREERAKSRRLTLFNNISRNIITTLNPDEMLAKIAEELDQVLDYSHMGIGLLDYSAKEVVIQAEAGKRKGALGRRLSFDGNVVGRVARTGQMAVGYVRRAALHRRARPRGFRFRDCPADRLRGPTARRAVRGDGHDLRFPSGRRFCSSERWPI